MRAGAMMKTARPHHLRVSSPRSARGIRTLVGSGPTAPCLAGEMIVSAKPHRPRVGFCRSALGVSTPAGSGPTAPRPAGAQWPEASPRHLQIEVNPVSSYPRTEVRGWMVRALRAGRYNTLDKIKNFTSMMLWSLPLRNARLSPRPWSCTEGNLGRQGLHQHHGESW